MNLKSTQEESQVNKYFLNISPLSSVGALKYIPMFLSFSADLERNEETNNVSRHDSSELRVVPGNNVGGHGKF